MTKNKNLAAIAKKHLKLETLDTRNSDTLDFTELAVWNIKAALEEAYDMGRRSVASEIIEGFTADTPRLSKVERTLWRTAALGTKEAPEFREAARIVGIAAKL